MGNKMLTAIAVVALLLSAACGKKVAEKASTPGTPEQRSGDKAADKQAGERKAAAEKAAAEKAATEKATAEKVAADKRAAIQAKADKVAAKVEAATPTTAKARDLLFGTGNVFMFSLEDSPQAFAAANAECAEEAAGVAAKQAACVAKVVADGAKEGFRFEPAGDKWTWVSFGQDADGNEEVYIQAVVDAQPSEFDQLIIKVAGDVAGKQWDAMPADIQSTLRATAMTILVVDADSVAMISPKKGKLIYHLKLR